MKSTQIAVRVVYNIEAEDSTRRSAEEDEKLDENIWFSPAQHMIKGRIQEPNTAGVSAVDSLPRIHRLVCECTLRAGTVTNLITRTVMATRYRGSQRSSC